ncbi:MAG: hypothetical protein ACO1OF_16980 [Adhaeribacter sp.]
MSIVADKIAKIVKEETSKYKSFFNGPSYHAIQHILRRLDVVLLFFHNDETKTKEEIEELREFFNYGWAPAIKPFYDDIDINALEPFPEMYKQARDWADYMIMHAGKIAFMNQLIAYEKADLIELDNPKKNEFSFYYRVQFDGAEYYDGKSKDFFREKIIEQHISELKKNGNWDEEDIKNKLRAIIKNPKGKYISYDATPEIDEYYNSRGHQFILRLQGYDDFAEDDMFGGIEYWRYLDLIATIAGVAIMHTEASLELTKMNPKVDLHNLLTYSYFKDKTIDIYTNYYSAPREAIEQIFSCITLNKDNFHDYLEYPSVALPMYVQVSENMLVRLVSGCLGNPFEILRRELKRKYKSDYDKAVNRREDRFRKELFYLFPQEHIIKVPKEINITFEGIRTDIDAVVYDYKTKTLGLFQLKWQDPFSKSMKERYSRITNLVDKANEWIEKMKFWLNSNSAQTILNSLQIDKQYNGKLEINDLYVFVLGRNNINYTNVKLDNQVAWGTWYQLIESQAVIYTDFNDPIREMFVKLKTFTPQNRKERDNLPEIPDFDTKVADYRLYYDKKRCKTCR